MFEPTTGNATFTGSIPRDGHTLTLLPNGQVLAAGGYTQKNNTDPTHSTISVTATAELFTPCPSRTRVPRALAFAGLAVCYSEERPRSAAFWASLPGSRPNFSSSAMSWYPSPLRRHRP